MRRILFLDFDGVLNSVAFAQRTTFTGWPDGHIDPEAIKHLNRLVAETSAKIVISSSWRKMLNDEELAGVLSRAGCVGEVVGKTPDFYQVPIWNRSSPINRRFVRGDEIQAWLDDHPEVETFAILDDDDDMAHLSNWLVQTSHETGLQAEHVERALTLLQDG
jgi:hypothetical protein